MKALDFGTAFKYPFNRGVGMLNILWVLVPIFGWFALGGYGVRLVKEFTQGKFEKLPEFNFADDMSLGFVMFFKSLPLLIVFGILLGISSEIHESLTYILEIGLGIFVLPMLFMNFMVKETVASSFELDVVKPVFSNIGDYLMTILKSIALAFVFAVMWLILVGIPAGSFTKNMFIADFYRRHVGKGAKA